MIRSIRMILAASIILTAGVLLAWQVTGGDYYTKFEVIEQVKAEPDPSDPLAAAGFYEDGMETRTISRREFRLGLLPTPQGLLDKHLLSVLTLILLIWVPAIALSCLIRRRASGILLQDPGRSGSSPMET